MNKWIPLTLLVFVGVLAVVIGQRMSTESMAVVIGVVFGVAASIPTSLLIASLMRRTLPTSAPPAHDARQPPSAQPMIIVNPMGQLPYGYGGQMLGHEGVAHRRDAVETPSMLPMPRRFRIIGADVNADV